MGSPDGEGVGTSWTWTLVALSPQYGWEDRQLDPREILPVMGNFGQELRGREAVGCREAGVQGGGDQGGGQSLGLGWNTSVRRAEPPASGFVARTKRESLWEHSFHCSKDSGHPTEERAIKGAEAKV